MIKTDEASLAVLNSLIMICYDGQFGYEMAASTVVDEELSRLLGEIGAQRMKFADELVARVRTLRSDPPTRGTPAGAVHRTWMEIRADQSNARAHAVLAECERAEDISVKAYRAALQAGDVDPQTHDLIQRQYEQVQLAHDRVKQLRDDPRYAWR